MKIVLASFFQQENHGSGRKIGISPAKPKNLDYECEDVFEPFSPGQLYWDYHKQKNIDPENAGMIFSNAFKKQMEDFCNLVTQKAKDENISVQEVLPFQDGDTLLTWEKKGNTSYRTMVADYLRELGYEVEES